MTLQDDFLIDPYSLEMKFMHRNDRNLSFHDFLYSLAKKHCAHYKVDVSGYYFDKSNGYYRVQYELPRA